MTTPTGSDAGTLAESVLSTGTATTDAETMGGAVAEANRTTATDAETMGGAIVRADVGAHPVLAIVRLESGRTVKYQKVKPSGSSYADDATWQTAMALEISAAVNQTMFTPGSNNATHQLAGLV